MFFFVKFHQDTSNKERRLVEFNIHTVVKRSKRQQRVNYLSQCERMPEQRQRWIVKGQVLLF